MLAHGVNRRARWRRCRRIHRRRILRGHPEERPSGRVSKDGVHKQSPSFEARKSSHLPSERKRARPGMTSPAAPFSYRTSSAKPRAMNRSGLLTALALALVIGLLFGIYPELDLKLAALFYDGATQSF